MSSAESKSPRSPKTSSSFKAHADAYQADIDHVTHPTDSAVSPSSNVPISVEPSSAPMDQHPDSPTIATPPTLPTSPEVMSSTVPDPSETVSLPQPSPATSPGVPDLEPSEPPKSYKSMVMRQQPIPPASEPMQYRAIGLVRGKYAPSEEQFTRGFLVTDDGVSIDAVLLGRVMSLVKKHLDLEQSHLWVVYPRTREKEYDLHVQIVGVWEPENLNSTIEADEATGEDAFEEITESDLAEEVEAAIDQAVLPAQAASSVEVSSVEASSVEASAKTPEAASTLETAVEASPAPAAREESIEDFDDRYFSVRGEVVFHSPENEQVLVKIRRIQRQGDKQSKAFKVVLRGALEGGKSVGYFWEFNVQRQENILTIQDATLIKMVPPQKGEGGNKFSRGPRRGAPPSGRKRWDAGSESAPPRREGAVPRPSRPVGDRPSRPVSERPLGGDRPVSDRPSRPAVPRERKEPATKPVLKRRNSEPSES